MHPTSCALCQRARLGNTKRVDVPYHGERHAVDLMFVFGLVLSEGTVPEQEKEREKRDT